MLNQELLRETLETANLECWERERTATLPIPHTIVARRLSQLFLPPVAESISAFKSTTLSSRANCTNLNERPCNQGSRFA